MHLLTIHDIEIGILVIAIFHLTFLHKIGGTAVFPLHSVEMALFIEGLFPFLVIVYVLHVNGYQGHIILSVSGQIDRHRSGKIVVTGRQGELSPCHVAEGDDALHLLEIHIAIAIGVIVCTRVVELKGMVELEVVAPLTILFVRRPAVTGIDGSRCTYQCKEKSR